MKQMESIDFNVVLFFHLKICFLESADIIILLCYSMTIDSPASLYHNQLVKISSAITTVYCPLIACFKAPILTVWTVPNVYLMETGFSYCSYLKLAITTV